MELYQEFLLTAFLSVILAALIGTLFSGRDADRDPEPENLGTGADAGAGAAADALLSPDPSASQHKHDEESRDDGVKIETADADHTEQEQEQERELKIHQVRAEQEDPSEQARSSEVDASDKRFEDSPREAHESLVEKEEGFAEGSDRCGENVVESAEVETAPEERSELEASEKRFEDSPKGVRESSVEEEEGSADESDRCGENVVKSTEVEIVVKDGPEGEKSGDDGDDEKLEEWEGIERTELDEQFGKASAYVGRRGGEFGLSSLSGDEQMQLYGLHKVAMEGPCYDPQPMALNISARARWHAWQRLGSMNPDVAMERYINLLSEKIPGWMQENPEEGGADKHEEAATSGTRLSKLPLDIRHQPSAETERKQEGLSYPHEEINTTVGNTGQCFDGKD